MAGAWPTSRNNSTAAQAYTGAAATSILSPPMYEFRSDTFTRPTEAMRRAMATAEVGDDVWGEDPTVIALEERAAAAVGKEAAIFVPSGTMGNAIGVRLHAGQGDALWAHDTSHVIDNEGGGPAALWGILPRGMLPAPDGLLRRRPTLRALVPRGRHRPPPRDRPAGLRREHVDRRAGRAVAARAAGRDRARTRTRAGMKVHMDGARLFNAAVALGVGADVICREVDTVQFCLSKGLGAPVGSMIAGTAEEMVRADRYRKLLGGGMRQAGIVAAAGIHALDHHVERLADDHANARRLAEGLAAPARGSRSTRRAVRDQHRAGRAAPATATRLRASCDELAAVGVLAAPYDRTRIRFVTSLEVDAGRRGGCT